MNANIFIKNRSRFIINSFYKSSIGKFHHQSKINQIKKIQSFPQNLNPTNKRTVFYKYILTNFFSLHKHFPRHSPMTDSPNNSLLKLQKFSIRSFEKKRRDKYSKNTNYKMKNRNALLKRIKIVGPSWNRHFMFKRTHHHHKNMKKSKNNLKRPAMKLISLPDRRYLKRNLPLFKMKKVKMLR